MWNTYEMKYFGPRGEQPGWENKAFDELRRIKKEEEQFLLSGIDIKEGAVNCPRCGSNKTLCHQEQTRRADEAMTLFIRCFACKKTFRQ